MKRCFLLLSLSLLLTCATLFGQDSSGTPVTMAKASTPQPGTESRTYPSGLVLPNEKKGYELGHYPLQILTKVRSKWFPQTPGLQRLFERQPSTTIVEFEIKKDGSLGKVSTVQSAGNTSLDAAAVGAISSSAPFNPIPDAYEGKTLKVQMHFGYDQPASSAAPFCDGPNWGAHPAGDSTVRRVGNGVKAPHPVSTPDPEFSEEARHAKYMSMVAVAGTVDSQGAFTDLCVVRAGGAGLDEKAIERLNTWKFEPGTVEGKPVPVRIIVETDFLLY